MATAASTAPIGGSRPSLAHYRQLEAAYGDLVGWAGSLYQLAEALQQQNDILKEQSEAWEKLYFDALRPVRSRLTLVRPEGA